jgi:hypothetical protein
VTRRRSAWLAALGLLLAAGAGLLAWFVALSPAHSSNLASATGYLTVGGAVAAVIAGLVTAVSEYRAHRSRSEYRSRISDIVDIGVSSPEAIRQADPDDLVVARYIVDREAAERRLAVYLPANPRRAKRLINHERLYRQIGENRRIFGGDPELTYDHMARWSLIVEEWPRLSAALTRDPAIMTTLESAADTDSLQQALDVQVPGVKATDELFMVLCGDGDVRLSPVLARLVRFETAPSPPAPQAPASHLPAQSSATSGNVRPRLAWPAKVRLHGTGRWTALPLDRDAGWRRSGRCVGGRGYRIDREDRSP